MKKITLALLACSALLTASSGHDHGHGKTSEQATLQTFTNDIIDNTTQVEFANSDKKMGATAIVGVGDEHNVLDLALRYQPINHLGFDIRLPIVDNEVTDENGIGDFSASANLHFGKFSDTMGTNIFTFRYKSTSGDEEKGLGSGADAYTVTYTMANDLSSHIRFYLLGTYTFNSDDDSDSKNVIEYEDAYAGMLGLSYESTVSTNTKVTYFEQDIPGGADTLTVADFWLEFSTKKIVPNVPMALGVKIPIVSEYDKDLIDLDKTYLFYFSMSSFFF
ncbi:MAG: hypothetical protein DRG24_02345 [Epsilonproteobacteria bacterium]|nr:MAG: hypothetical protein DRG24_02345 [Campylobacterota bacterium]